ncbi:MAG TPA: hypothetical protein VFH56_07675 [Acidimicrobiales bacterium]|nr:hypothetical protein [Acidimicrobiales bacterium]
MADVSEADCYEPFSHDAHDWTEDDTGRVFRCPGVVARDWRNYGEMSREELIERLRHAEDVCVYFGWTGAAPVNDNRAQAATELWMRWARLDGVDTSVASNVDLASAEQSLADIAEQRHERRRAPVVRVH